VGHRSNTLVIDHGNVQRCTDRWAALGLPGSLLHGVGAVLASYPREKAADKLYDEVWAEGGLLADRDQKVLLFYTDINIVRNSVGLRRALLPLIAERWPGWRVGYASRGLGDLLDHAGLPYDGLVEHRDLSTASPGSVREGTRVVASVLGRPLCHLEYVSIMDPFLSYQESVVSVRYADGEVRDHPVGLALSDLLAMGPDLLEVLGGEVGESMPTEQAAHGGAYVDVPARTVAAWWASGRESPAALAGRWPGWDFHVHDGGLPEQATMSGRTAEPVRLSRAVLVEEAFESLVSPGYGDIRDARRRLLDDPEHWSMRGLGDHETAALRRLATPPSGA
jgi:hypothetical protein